MEKTTGIPPTGQESAVVLERLRGLLESDYQRVSLKAGRLTYWSLSPSAIPSEPFIATAREAAALFAHESQFYLYSQPSIIRLTADVLQMVRPLVAADVESVVGSVTMGGTESISLAIKAARDFARAHGRLAGQANIVIPATAHPAFNKATEYFDLQTRRVPVTDAYKADVAAMRRAVDENTVLIAGSAPSYTHGSIDPIAELSDLALEKRIWLHVDACIGGFILPFMRMAGQHVEPFDFALPGVSSISIDLHKHAFAPIGISTLFCRDTERQSHHVFRFDDWPAGTFRSPIFNSSRPASPLAGAWATMMSLGTAGYIALAKRLIEAQRTILEGIRSIDGLRICGDPSATSIAYTSTTLDIHSIAEKLAERGWYSFPIKDPPGLHVIVEPFEDRALCHTYIEDLRWAAQHAAARPSTTSPSTASYS